MIYELYINDIAVDIDSDEDISLLYQSPIFGDLNSIISNRSYNIALPLSATNKRAVGLAHRVDSASSLVYTRIPARLYVDGDAVFESGYAVVTDIDSSINVTLTWGNIDRLSVLFDESLQDLPVVTSSGAAYLEWNSSTVFIDPNVAYMYTPTVAFFPTDFGMGKVMMYSHPSVMASYLVELIEERHSVSFGSLGDVFKTTLLPLMTRNSNGGYGGTTWLSSSSARLGVPTWTDDTSMTFEGGKLYLPSRTDPNNIYDTSTYEIDISEIDTMYIALSDSSGSIYLQITSYEVSAPAITIDVICDSDTYLMRRSAYKTKQSTGSGNGYTYEYWFYSFGGTFSVSDYDSLTIALNYTDTILTPSSAAYTFTLKASVDDTAIYPGYFPLQENLPDITQGAFINELMTRLGWFAYPEEGDTGELSFFSVDDLYTAIEDAYQPTGTVLDGSPQYELSSSVTDWSDCIILNEMGEVSMANSISFTLGDYAQKNTFDYSNDDDVTSAGVDLSGEILIDNNTLESEAELFASEFSGCSISTQSGAGSYTPYIPIYTQDDDGEVEFNELSPRICGWDNSTQSGLTKTYAMTFTPYSSFGDPTYGIIARKYTGLTKLLQSAKKITISVKLSQAQIKQVRFEKPIYIAQFGAFFVLYTLTTSSSGIHEAELIKMA